MINEEMRRASEFMMQRREVFTGHPGRLEENQEMIQGEVRGLTTEARGLSA